MALTRINNNSLSDVTSAGLPEGSVIQVVTAEKTSAQNIPATSSWVDVTDFSIDITPRVSNSTMIITIYARYGNDTSSNNGMRLLRDSSTIIGNGDSDSLCNVAYNLGGNRPYMDFSIAHFDTPGTTNSVNYKIQAFNSSGTFTFNGRGGETNDDKYCQMIIMEIAGA